MSSHCLVRAVISRLAALWLVALLAAPGVGTGTPDPGPETGAASAPDAGMNAPPGPAVSAACSAVPVGPAAPLSAAARVTVTVSPLVGVRAEDPASHPPVVVRFAPAVLRL
jgi:hypothetical protein